MIYLSTVCKEKTPSLILWLTGRPLNMGPLKNCSPSHVHCTLDVPADFSNEDVFYLPYLLRAQNAEKVSTGTPSQHITGIPIQIHLYKSSGSPKVAQMPLLPESNTKLALRKGTVTCRIDINTPGLDAFKMTYSHFYILFFSFSEEPNYMDRQKQWII